MDLILALYIFVLLITLTMILIAIFYKGGLNQAWKDLTGGKSHPAPGPGPKPSDQSQVPPGCTLCAPGVVYCPNEVLPDNLKQAAPNKGMLMSTYRLPDYDPEAPNVILGNFQYYYRQAVQGCP